MFLLSTRSTPLQTSSDEIKHIFLNKSKIHVKNQKLYQIESEAKKESMEHRRVSNEIPRATIER